MRHDKFALTRTVLTCLALAVHIPFVEGQRVSKKITVHVKVSAEDGNPLPSKVVIEVSGKEKACGKLSLNDELATVDENGEAVFELPVCKVTVKANVPLYLQAVAPVDLAEYKSPIRLILQREE
jgi:hypothetical protein